MAPRYMVEFMQTHLTSMVYAALLLLILLLLERHAGWLGRGAAPELLIRPPVQLERRSCFCLPTPSVTGTSGERA